LDFDDILPKKIKNLIRHIQDFCKRITTNGEEDPMASTSLRSLSEAVHRFLDFDPVPPNHHQVCDSKQEIIRGIGGGDRNPHYGEGGSPGDVGNAVAIRGPTGNV
jgi:hypothetical protein